MKRWTDCIFTIAFFAIGALGTVNAAKAASHVNNLKGEDGTDARVFDQEIREFLPEALIKNNPRLRMLILSGGGSYGPWGTGVLKGWASNGRPGIFHVVTGVSTGAMIAPFAYIGNYLEKNIFPDYVKHRNNIQRRRLFLELPFSNSLYSLKKLSKLIYEFMEPPKNPDESGGNYDSLNNQYNLLRLVGNTYSGNGDSISGRLLLIGTVSLESGVFCTWNLGEIAARAIDSDHDGTYSKLFHDVLLASTAMPGFYPPVNIDLDGVTDLNEIVYDPDVCKSGNHVDGGVRRQAFVLLTEFIHHLWVKFGDGSSFDAWAIVNRKLVPPRVCKMKNTLLFNGKRGLEVLMTEALIGNLYRIKSVLTCAESTIPNCNPANFQFSYIPHDKDFEYPVDEFPKKPMESLRRDGEMWGMRPVCKDGAGSSPNGWCEKIPVKEISEVSCTP